MKAPVTPWSPQTEQVCSPENISQFTVKGWVGPGFLAFSDKEFKL